MTAMGWFSAGSTREVSGDIQIENVRPDEPEFRRVYAARLDDRATIKVEMKTWSTGRYSSGELKQPNGRRISFDPRAIADKIIDPLLVPLVEKAVAEIFQIDRDYIASNPAEFIDRRGTKWKRDQ